MNACPWSAYAPATIAFCEARLCGWVVEPSNAWSNLGYVLIGALVLRMSHRRAPLVLIGIASILIGIGSFSFHGTGTRLGELLDVSAMYLISGLGVMYAARRIGSLSSTALIAGYVGLVGASIGLMIALHNNGIVVFAIQIAIAVFAELYLYKAGRRAPGYRDQKLMIVSFAAAFLIWNLDKLNILCAPDNHFITGHAVWHVLTAVAIYFFARQQALLLQAA